MEPLNGNAKVSDDVNVNLQTLKQTLSELKDVFDQRLRTKNAKYEEAQELQASLLKKRKDLKLLEKENKKLEEIQSEKLLNKKGELEKEEKNITDLETELDHLSSQCDMLKNWIRLECKFLDKDNPTKVTAAYLMKYSPQHNSYMKVRCLPLGQPCGPAQLDMYWSWLEQIIEKERIHEQQLEEQQSLRHEKRE